MLNRSDSTIQAKHFDSQTSRWSPTYSSDHIPIVSNHTADDQFSHAFAPSFLTVKAILLQSTLLIHQFSIDQLSIDCTDNFFGLRENWQNCIIFTVNDDLFANKLSGCLADADVNVLHNERRYAKRKIKSKT